MAREVHRPISIFPPPGRCPSWSPGNEFKCEREKGHAGQCHAHRLGHATADPGSIFRWDFRCAGVPDGEEREAVEIERRDLLAELNGRKKPHEEAREG